MAFIRVNIGTADRRHRHLDQYFAIARRAQRVVLHDERRVWRFVNSGLGGTHYAAFSLVSFGSKFRPTGLKRWPSLFDTVERKIENIIVVQGPSFRLLLVLRIERT